MSGERVLVVETSRASAPSFAPSLKSKGYQIAVEHTAAAAITRAVEFRPAIIVLDAASLRTSGTRMCRETRRALNGVRILLVVNAAAKLDPNCGADVTLVLPFTPRKLLNAIYRLLPVHGGTWLEAGPIKLNVSRRRVKCGDEEHGVTPKQARLLEILMRNAGEVVTRKYIIKHVWETDYTGDTRTLDVHISWLRKLIEPNPQKPQYLRTVRGKGYILNLKPAAGR